MTKVETRNTLVRPTEPIGAEQVNNDRMPMPQTAGFVCCPQIIRFSRTVSRPL